jgi:hypothetical protein
VDALLEVFKDSEEVSVKQERKMAFLFLGAKLRLQERISSFCQDRLGIRQDHT